MKNFALGLIALYSSILLVSCRHSAKDYKPLEKIDEMVFSIPVNYDVSLKSLIDSGHYSHVCSRFKSENFPEKNRPNDTIVVHLIKFSGWVNSDTVMAFLNKNDLRPGTPKEFMTMELDPPSYDDDISIVSLYKSNPISSFNYVCFIENEDGDARVKTKPWESEWWDAYFIAIKK